MRSRGMVSALVLVGLLATAGCGSDEDEAAKAVTHEEWFKAVCEKMTGGDPGFDAFFTEHPDPTLEDWAAFLPGPIEQLGTMVTALETTPHAEEDDAKITAAIAAIRVVKGDLEDSLAAAKAGDQAAYDAAEAKNQGGDSEAMEAALGAVESRDCPAPAS